ncbi:hypothetical protein AMAG_14137 [Allomyces macrogynus ATCC 38327]|uniref:EF-hand domain-containing protein n=1 Tax=Allomyces macrogynus (strain ATCC 38327) TaxID=578462 RepID=A0A0L0T4D8_ALLM3|nr:hypothetical protein AMAG_14137 [Allomyces macrogynus ATCC 38327]|eukprot:KNE69580.1 hypothetical protein AMAG_14137 [Allomyces macrogynus ATCC 38327]
MDPAASQPTAPHPPPIVRVDGSDPAAHPDSSSSDDPAAATTSDPNSSTAPGTNARDGTVSSVSLSATPSATDPAADEARRLAALRALGQQPVTLSAGELAAAFAFLSSDGVRVTRTDVRDFIDYYFPDLADKLERPLTGGTTKEDREISLATLIKVMNRKRDVARATWDDVGKIFAAQMHVPVANGVLVSGAGVASVVDLLNSGEYMTAPSDVDVVMQALDPDGDGVVNVDDWRQIKAHCEAHPKVQKMLDSLF